jgi:hypothetical protein
VTTLTARTLICNVASLFSGVWGAVSTRAREANCSRQAIYQQRERVVQAVSEAQGGGPTRAELQAENQRLRDENRQLWAWLAAMVEFPAKQQQRFASEASAMGLSAAQIVALLTIVLGKARPSRAKVARWVGDAAHKAGKLLAILDRHCWMLVWSLCLDEIFLRRQPVLMGVEPHSMTWVMGQRTKDRKGTTWNEQLRPWTQLTYAVVDGGNGLRKGLDLTLQQRRLAGSTVPLEINLDNFHIQQGGRRALRAEWEHAEHVWEQAEQADRIVAEKERQGRKRCGALARARVAWQQATKALATAERREAAFQRVVAALELFAVDGRLNDRTTARAAIEAAVQDLPGPRWGKFRRMALDGRALTFLDRLQRELAAAEPRAELREALVKLWQQRHPRRSRQTRQTATRDPRDPLQVALHALICQKLDPQWQEAYRRVAAVLANTVRASSVVECMNSVVRMHQARHRGLSQRLLDLKRLYWNCRTFMEGKRKLFCPYGKLGLKLPTYDWWELLQMDPAELEQQLSSTKVAA